MEKYLIDTNFIARILIKDSPEQLQIILDFISLAVQNKYLLYVDRSVVFELVYVLSGNIYQLSRQQVKLNIDSLLDLECFTFEDSTLIYKSLELYATSTLDVVDTFLISKALAEGYELYSFDKKAMATYKKLFSEIA
ncbi:MAG: PIN domain-containing protein [bacterium]